MAGRTAALLLIRLDEQGWSGFWHEPCHRLPVIITLPDTLILDSSSCCNYRQRRSPPSSSALLIASVSIFTTTTREAPHSLARIHQRNARKEAPLAYITTNTPIATLSPSRAREMPSNTISA